MGPKKTCLSNKAQVMWCCWSQTCPLRATDVECFWDGGRAPESSWWGDMMGLSSAWSSERGLGWLDLHMDDKAGVLG